MWKMKSNVFFIVSGVLRPVTRFWKRVWHPAITTFCCRDFAVKMAAALQERMSCPLQSINLSGNPIEDKGMFVTEIHSSVLEQKISRIHCMMSATDFSDKISKQNIWRKGFLFLFVGVTALSQQLHLLDEGLKHLSLSCISMTAKGTYKHIPVISLCFYIALSEQLFHILGLESLNESHSLSSVVSNTLFAFALSSSI